MMALGFDDVDKAISDTVCFQQASVIETPTKPGVGMAITRKPADCSEAALKELTQAQQ